jgi:hypothetical protein
MNILNYINFIYKNKCVMIGIMNDKTMSYGSHIGGKL